MQETRTPSTSGATNGQPSPIGDYFSFKKMITLNIIQILYAVVAVLITIGSLGLMASDDNDFLPGGPLMGFIVLVVANVLWRIWCEWLIVFFRINKSLASIDRKTGSN